MAFVLLSWKEDCKYRNFPGGPVIKTAISECRATGPIPGGETKIPLAKKSETANTPTQN